MTTPDEQTVERVAAAVSEALGEALDCTRVWSAWGYGTMGENDFVRVADDAERVDEITCAAIAAMPDTKALTERIEDLEGAQILNRDAVERKATRIAELEAQVSKARENALREASEVGDKAQRQNASVESAILALIDKEPTQ